MSTSPSILSDAAANLGGHIRGKPNVLWRRPDPTASLATASGLQADALPAHLRSLRARARRASAFEMAGFAVNLAACLGLCAYAYDAWPVPTPALAGIGISLLGALHFGTQVRARVLRTRRTFGGGAPQPGEASPKAMAITPYRLYVAGERGRPHELAHEHLHAIEILDRGMDDFLVRFWIRQKDGPSVFAEASRVPETAARSLVEAMRGRGPRFEGEGARFAAELDARTVVLTPETFDAARAAVAKGRYRTLADAANAALSQALAA